MFPYEKHNLVPYRFLLTGSGLLFVGGLIVGILTDSAYGLFFMVLHGFVALLLARNLFVWSPEPTARRQFAVALVVTIIIGLAGGFAMDWATDRYFLSRDECTDRLWVTFQCDR